MNGLPRPRDVLGAFGIYVHIPFCSHRCWYCDFNAYAGLEAEIGPYLEALVEDVAEARSAPPGVLLEDRPRVTSIFIGGGTPSLVPARSLRAVLEAVRGAWDVAPDAEITIECNPESVDDSKIETYLEAGVNRVSVGVQSLDDGLLVRLGRTHDAAAARRALETVRRAGVRNFSADLMYGIPGEGDEAFLSSLEGVVESGVTHVSCYALTYEEGTPLAAWRRSGRVVPISDDDVARRWELANDLLVRAGLERYEVSNWARPGRRSRHNSLYWACGEYLGVGAGAHSHLATPGGALRSWAPRSPRRYAGGSGPAGWEEIGPDERAAEVMLLGLRLTEGVARARFAALCGRPLDAVYAEALGRARELGLLDDDGEGVAVRDPLLVDAAVRLFV